MFDPFLRAVKGSQLLFICAAFSLSTPIFAAESSPELETDSLIQDKSELDSAAAKSLDSLDMTNEPQLEQQVDEEIQADEKQVAEQAEEKVEEENAGPELVVDSEVNLPLDEADVETSDSIKVQTVEGAKTSEVNDELKLGPLLTAPQVKTSNDSSLSGFPALNMPSEQEAMSLDLLWQKTFPTNEKSAQDVLIDTPKTPIVVDETVNEIAAQELVENDDRPSITIIIDDLGYNRRGMEESLDLPVEVALAILPHTPFSKKTARAATEQARTILLHVPMENERELKLGPGGLYKKMDEAELKKTLQEGIESVPGITGINNHMGSLLTQDVESMQWVMEVIQPLELFFVDSLTSPNSVALSKALSFDLTTTRRDVFLDNIQEEKAIDKQFKRLLAIARKRGKALAIGHPYPATMNYLAKHLSQLEDEGVQLISLADYIE